MSFNKLPLSFLISTILTSTSAVSETNNQNTAQKSIEESMEQIAVYGNGYRSTGAKSDLQPMKSPMSASNVDQEMLTLRQADSVNKALRYVSGITPESRSTVTIFDQYTIRGFDTYQNFYDGLPLQYNGMWNLVPQVDAFATESVEVLKGPTSVLYGAAPPGGLVNQIAKSPIDAEGTKLRVKGGSHNLAEVAVDTAGDLNESGDVSYRLIALARKKDGQQQTTEEERYTFAPSIGWQVNDDTQIEFSAYYQDDPEMVPSTPLPAIGTVDKASYGKLDSDAYAGDENWSTYEREVLMLGFKINHQINDDWNFLQNFRYTTANAYQENTYNNGLAEDGVTLSRSAYYTDEEQDGFVVDNQLSTAFVTGDTLHKVLIGIDYQTLDSTVKYGDTLGMLTPDIDLSNPDHDLINPDLLPVDFYTEHHKIEQEQVGIYLQNQMEFYDFSVIIGGRYDTFESQDIANNSYAGSEYGSDTKIDQEQFSGRIAAIYYFDSGISPYVNLSQSFEPTSGVDTNTGKAFEPTTADQVEVGVKYQNSDDSLRLTVAGFEIVKENVVINTEDWMQYTQAGEITSKGVEVELQYEPSADIKITANYSNLDMEITENPLNTALQGKSPVWVADEQASLWVNYFPNVQGLMLGAGVRYVGETYMDQMNSDIVPSYTLVDMVASYDISDTYRVNMSINNLEDKRYVGSCYDANNCWMGAERSAEVSLEVSF